MAILRMRICPLCILLSLFTIETAFSQDQSRPAFNSILPHHNIGMIIRATLLPGGSINTTAGNYYLKSKPQLSFSGAFIYKLNLDHEWNIDYGIGLSVISTNYRLHIPAEDLPGHPSPDGAPQVEIKEAYFKTALSALLSYNFLFDKQGFWSMQLGGKLNYSGFSIDERVRVEIADSNRRLTKIFQGDFTSNNNKKPWISYVGGLSKTVKLKNEGLFSFGVLAELSTTKFIKGKYQIIVPNKPVGEGEYSVNGSGIGISFQYLFPKKKNSTL